MSWPLVPLSSALANAAIFVDGDWVESKDQDPDGDVRLIQLADVGDGSYVDKSSRFMTSTKAKALKCTYLERGDVLVARMPDPLGRACMFPGDPRPAVTVVDVCIIRPGVGGPDGRFLMHCLNSEDCRNQIAGFATGTTRSRISRSNLGKIRILLPPLSEQRRIAEILDKADALRAKRRAAIAKLDTLTQSIFLDMFGDPATNPKGWPVTPLGDLCVRITDGTHQPPKWSDKGHPFIFISNVVNGEITFDTEKYISDETYAELTKRCPIEIGDVLYSTVGSYGVPAIVRSSKRFAFQRHIAHLKPNRTLLDSEFLRVMLASPPLKRQADRAARGIAQKTINLADIREFLVFSPPIEYQKELAARSSRITALRSVAWKAEGELGDLFLSIQRQVFQRAP